MTTRWIVRTILIPAIIAVPPMTRRQALRYLAIAYGIIAAYPIAARAQQALPTFGEWVRAFYQYLSVPQSIVFPGNNPFRNFLSPELRTVYDEILPNSQDA